MVHNPTYVRYEVSTAVKIETGVMWVVTPCSVPTTTLHGVTTQMTSTWMPHMLIFLPNYVFMDYVINSHSIFAV